MFLCFGVTGTKANSGKVKRIPDAKLAVGNNRPFVFKCCSYARCYNEVIGKRCLQRPGAYKLTISQRQNLLLLLSSTTSSVSRLFKAPITCKQTTVNDTIRFLEIL